MRPGSLDGYDLGILIRLKRFGGWHELGWINSQVISEVGWLKGGTLELYLRMANLLNLGCVEIMKPTDDDYKGTRFYDSTPQFRFVTFEKTPQSSSISKAQEEKQS